MWYEILPAAALVSFFYSVPGIFIPAGNWLLHGTPMLRDPKDRQDLELWRRDQKLSYKGDGDGHRTVYFEGLPDRK